MQSGTRHKKSRPWFADQRQLRKIIKLRELYHINQNLSSRKEIDMEQRYKAALEIILNLCKELYPSREEIQSICETALEREDEQNESA